MCAFDCKPLGVLNNSRCGLSVYSQDILPKILNKIACCPLNFILFVCLVWIPPQTWYEINATIILFISNNLFSLTCFLCVCISVCVSFRSLRTLGIYVVQRMGTKGELGAWLSYTSKERNWVWSIPIASGCHGMSLLMTALKTSGVYHSCDGSMV